MAYRPMTSRDPNTLRAQYLENGWISRLRSKGPPIENGLWAIKWSRDRWRLYVSRCCEAVRSAILATTWLLVWWVICECCCVGLTVDRRVVRLAVVSSERPTMGWRLNSAARSSRRRSYRPRASHRTKTGKFQLLAPCGLASIVE